MLLPYQEDAGRTRRTRHVTVGQDEGEDTHHGRNHRSRAHVHRPDDDDRHRTSPDAHQAPLGSSPRRLRKKRTVPPHCVPSRVGAPVEGVAEGGDVLKALQRLCASPTEVGALPQALDGPTPLALGHRECAVDLADRFSRARWWPSVRPTGMAIVFLHRYAHISLQRH